MIFPTRNFAGPFRFAVAFSFRGLTGRKNPMQRARMHEIAMLKRSIGIAKCPEARTPWVERIMLTVIPMAMFMKKPIFFILRWSGPIGLELLFSMGRIIMQFFVKTTGISKNSNF